jgi:hypothetical protein
MAIPFVFGMLSLGLGLGICFLGYLGWQFVMWCVTFEERK